MTNDPNQKLEEIVNDAMTRQLRSSDAETPNQDLPEQYRTIDAYQTISGKRFRITKAQKDRGITREEAFREFVAVRLAEEQQS